MKKTIDAITRLLTECEVTCQPVCAPESKCLAVFRAAAHFRFAAAMSDNERELISYDPRDWNELFEPGECATLADARKAGVRAACSLLA